MPGADETHRRTIITLYGSCASVGRTTIAVNLAAALAQSGHKVALIDLDVRFGDVSILLDIPVEQSIADLSVEDGKLSLEMLQHSLYTHETGVTILPAPVRPKEWQSVGAAHVEQAVALLAQTHDYVLLDSPKSYKIVSAGLEQADSVLMVTTADESSLESTRRDLDMLRWWSFPHDRIKLVVNAINDTFATRRRPNDIGRMLGLEVFFSVPYDRKVSTATQLGMPVVVSHPNSKFARGIEQLAKMLPRPAHASGRTPQAARRAAEPGGEEPRLKIDKKRRGSTSMIGEERLRRAVDVVKQGLDDPSWDEPVPDGAEAELWQALAQDTFQTFIGGSPSAVKDAIEVAAEMLLGRRQEMRSLWRELGSEDMQDLYAFNLLLHDMLLSYRLDLRTIARITDVEGFIASWAALVGRWTAIEPHPPSWRELPTRLRGWKLVAPKVSATDAERNRAGIMEGLRSMGIDEFLGNRVTQIIVAQSTTPLCDEIASFARCIAPNHLRRLTALRRAAEHVMKLAIRDRSTRDSLMVLLLHVTYTGLLVGQRLVRAAAP